MGPLVTLLGRDVQSIIEKTIIAMIGEQLLIANYFPPQLLIANFPITDNYLTEALQGKY